MKRKNLLLLTLLPLGLIGCKNNEQEKPLDYEKLADFGTAYKCIAEMNASGKLGEGLPNGIQNTKATFEQNGDIAYEKTSLEGTLTGTLEETANYLSEQFDKEVKVAEIETYLNLAKQYSGILDYKIEGDTVTADMMSNAIEHYYDYSSHGVLPVTWTYDSNETSSTYQKWVGRTSFYNHYEFDLTDYAKHAKDFTLDRENNVLSITDARAKELKLIDDEMVLVKFNMYLNDNDRISKIEQVFTEDGITQEINYNIEMSSNLALPAAENRAPLCTHTELDTSYFGNNELNGEHYHYNYCSVCSSCVNIQKCHFDEDGFCEVCGFELTKEIRLVGPENYEPMVYLVVNAITNKIYDVSYNYYCDSLDGGDYITTDYEYNYFDILVCDAITSEIVPYGSIITVYYNDTPYSYLSGYNADGIQVYFFLTNCVIDEEDVMEQKQYTLTYDSIVKYVVGSIYTA